MNEMPSDFAVAVQPIDAERSVVAVRGDLDLFSTNELKRALVESLHAGRIRIILDLSATTLIDSCTLGVLIGMVKRLQARDGALAIVNVNDSIARAFELTGLDRIFTIVATLDDAILAVSPVNAA